jgi:hypothetical protein
MKKLIIVLSLFLSACGQQPTITSSYLIGQVATFDGTHALVFNPDATFAYSAQGCETVGTWIDKNIGHTSGTVLLNITSDTCGIVLSVPTTADQHYEYLNGVIQLTNN